LSTTLHTIVTLADSGLPIVKSRSIVPITLVISAFLCLLNVGLSVFFRKNKHLETLSYYAAGTIEFVIFVFSVLAYLGIITHLPVTLPPALPINEAEIGAALAIGIGLFPAAYWHRVNLSELPKRIVEDGKTMKEREGNVRVRNSIPGEWMN
jgi:hypothetical protein